MFRKNKQQQQPSFFNSDFLMPGKMREQLYASWAHTFRVMVFARIPEERFAVLYSEKESRPNAPINVLVGGDMLKDGFGWSDEVLEQHLQFDLQTRYALGLDDLSQSVPTLRTFQNHRRRVREHAQASGENLYEVVFQAVTDEHLQQLQLKTGWQRMDSTQLLSNIAQVSRLELVLRVLQRGVAGLPAARQAIWRQEEADYLGKQPRHICYRLKNEEVPGYLQKTGELLAALLTELVAEAEASQARELVARVLREQYQIEAGEKVVVRAPQEVSAASLQSPHDPEATYREKNGERYRGNVVNVSETCDPENQVQLITSVQTASNNTDDSQLLAQSLNEQAERGHKVEKATVDGGYTGPVAEAACAEHGTELHPSRLRGGKAQANKWGWESYSWQLTEEGVPEQVGCRQGQVAVLEPAQKEGRWLARFESAGCATCPFFDKQCRVQPRQRSGPTLNVTARAIQVALLRQRVTAANNGVRAAVEATIRSLKHPFAADKLPVRGLIRAQMVVCGSALLVNVHRLCHFFQEQAVLLMGETVPVAQHTPNQGDAKKQAVSARSDRAPVSLILPLFVPLIFHLMTICRRFRAIFQRRSALMTLPLIMTMPQPHAG